MNDRGKLAEMAAADYLKRRFYKLVDYNYKTRFGEIDLILTKGKYIVFAEVKQRDVSSFGTPAEAVTRSKQQKIISSAKLYLQANKTDLQPRFDVIEVYTENNKIKSIKHLANAFEL